MISLSKQEREQIFSLFLHSYKLKFSEIERAVKIRSNMIAYHLEQLQKEGILLKQNSTYSLTPKGEKYLPIINQVKGEQLSPLPVILIAPVRNGKVLLIQRAKRPYKDWWALIGGKINFGETLQEACMRKTLELTGAKSSMLALNALADEQVEEEGTKHHFLLHFVTAELVTAPKHGTWHSIRELDKLQIIPSDKWLLQKKLKSKVRMQHIRLQEKHGQITVLKIV
jgi:ADP-ribose pyrophosphatase YjhB (NUDIX family)/predicted transcriptional regulator